MHAQQLSQQWQIPLQSDVVDAEINLHLDERGLSLHFRDKRFKPFHIEFESGKLGYRQQHLQHELIIKACGLKPGQTPTIIDATAGFGRDAFILASFGAKVMMIEQANVLAAMLDDALARLTHPLTLQLHHGNAIDYLQTHDHADIIYCDPMFPLRKKSALVKKELRIIQAIIEEQHNDAELLQQALSKAKSRVVVKRPRIATSVPGPKPNFSIDGKAIRFDIYLMS